MHIDMVSKDPMDYVRVALALETLAYHNKNFLDTVLAGSNAKFSEEIQWLLYKALAIGEEAQYDT